MKKGKETTVCRRQARVVKVELLSGHKDAPLGATIHSDIRLLQAHRAQQNCVAMIIQEVLLAFRKRADIDDPVRGDTHSLQ